MHLALGNGGFSLCYPPRADVRTGTVFGIESLLRMCRANGKLISPGDFIPLTDETGFIIPIGQWILEMASRDAMRKQQALCMALKVAVNITPRQFMNGGPAEAVEIALPQMQMRGLSGDPSALPTCADWG